MKRRDMRSRNGASRFLGMVLAALVLLGGTPVSARGEAGLAHFQDVPDGHWAFEYVERAYQDGAMVGVGGDPAAGTGLFAPDEYMTCGQFLTMLINAFYPDELVRTGKDGPWYAPAVRVAADRGIVTDSLDQLMRDASKPIDRDTAAKVLVRLMDDKCVVLPDGAEREKAAASIGDWADVEAQEDREGNKIQAYYVSSIYAMGVMSGVDEAGTFAGSDPITRANAAALYVKAAEKLKSSQNDPKAFRVEFAGDWDGVVPEGYKEEFEQEFYTVFPRMWARWGNANVSKHVTLRMVPQEDLIIDRDKGLIALGVTVPARDAIRQRYDYSIWLSIEVINSQPWGPGLLAHEMAHAATNHYPSFKSSWWLETIADYGFFRYCSWADSRYPDGSQVYQADEKALRDCDYKDTIKLPWFFAYMDEKYPTTATNYGLIDSLHRAMRTGQITSDGGQDQSDAAFNAVVKRITGYDNIELLRQRYIRELDEGTWTFDGYAGFPDNFLTENLPGVPNPDYPIKADFNLCAGATVVLGSGKDLGEVGANNLIDGDVSTGWIETLEEVNLQDKRAQEVQHWIELRFDYKPITFNTYTLYHQGGKQNTRAWRLWYRDAQDDQWKMVDEVGSNTDTVTTRRVEPVTAKGLWLDVLQSDRAGDGTVRLYELELFYKE